MTSTRMIELAHQRYDELIHKGWEWRSFYNGFLEGITSLPDYNWNQFPESIPPEPGLYLVIKKDKGHGRRIDRMRWYPFDSGLHPGVREMTCGWGGNYGRSVTHWARLPDMPPEATR